MIINKRELENYEFELGYTLNELCSMKITESYMIKNTLNKIKRITTEDWIFLRFDSINTHIHKNVQSNEDNKKLWDSFKESCNYSLKYAKDRVDSLKNNWNDDLASRISSTNSYINEQVKTTNSQLSGEKGITRTLEKIADYIVFAKFDNANQEKSHIDLKNEIQRIEKIKKKNRKEADQNRVTQAKEASRNTPSAYTRRLKKPPKHLKFTSTERIIEEDGGVSPIGNIKIDYSRVDKQMNQGKFDAGMKEFWDRYSPSKSNSIPWYYRQPEKYSDFSYNVVKQFIDEISYLNELPFNIDRAKQISNLKGEMRSALEILRKEIHLQPTNTIAETVPQDAWNRLSLRNTDTYISLLYGYYEANERYNCKPSTNFWALLRTFEKLVNDSTWTEEEKVILKFILETGITDHKSIKLALLEKLQVEVPQRNISNIINKYIPNKLLNTYEISLEDWIWVHRRKGTYKTCKKCNEVKLAVDNRYYHSKKSGELGLKAVCKKCIKK